MKNTYLIPVVFSALLLINLSVYAQPEPTLEQPVDQSLKGQFQEMLDKSESYTDYKVVNRTRLSAYSKAVHDSLQINRDEIKSLKTQVAEQKSQITQLSSRISDLEAQLATSESLREGLVFLGINMNKTTYHWIVWVLIGGLAAFGIFAYTSFIRSNKITAKSKKEYKVLEVDYDEHKKKSHEKQLKIGRELQTERNRVEELKTKLKSKS